MWLGVSKGMLPVVKPSLQQCLFLCKLNFFMIIVLSHAFNSVSAFGDRLKTVVCVVITTFCAVGNHSRCAHLQKIVLYPSSRHA